MVSKIFEKLVNNRIVDHYGNVAYMFLFSMVLGLLDQMQIFWQLHLEFLKAPFFGPKPFLPYIDDLPDDIYNIAIYAGDTTLYSKYD